MSNENTINDLLRQYNVSLVNMEAALTVIEYCIKNDQPVSALAKLTVQEACEEVQETSKLLMIAVGE